MAHHRAVSLSKSLSSITLADLPPGLPGFGQLKKGRRRPGFLLCAAALLVALSLLAQLTARADTANPTPVVTVDAASYQTTLAPNGIAAAFGTQLATQTVAGTDADPNTPGIQLPTTLAGSTVEVNGVAAGLFFVSPNQINYLIPANTSPGTATVVVRSGNSVVSQGTMTVAAAAPTIFTISQTGQGAAAALVYNGSGFDPAFDSDGSTRPLQAGQILVLFGQGIRGAGAGQVHVLIGGIDAQVDYAGAQGGFVGLDQINVHVPDSLQGRGVVDVVVTVGSVASNAVNIEVAGASAGSTPPTVTSFSAGSALAGQTITIQGTNFSTTASANKVRIGSMEALVTQATATQLTVVVPFGVISGQVTVETGQGGGQSASALSVRTSISGTIQSTGGTALQGATVRLSGTTKTTTTNDQGLFLLSDVPAGAAVVEVDGATVTANPPYPTVVLKMVVSANRDNQVAQPVSLQQNTGGSVNISGGSGSSGREGRRTSGRRTLASQVTSNGVTLNIPGAVTFPNGSTTGTVYLTTVNRAKVPVPLPPRVFSSTIVQIAPFDATFSPAADITFPNTDNIAAGTVVDLYAYDTSITPSGFTKRGTAQVSADGQTIVGTGVIDKASIWFAAIPQILTTTVKGTIVDAAGKAVRGAHAHVKGRGAVSDGNGAFAIPDVFVKNGEQLTADVRYLSPTGVALVASKTATAVPNGVTDMGAIQLPAEPPLVLALAPRGLFLTISDTAQVQLFSSSPAPAGGRTVNLSSDTPTVATVVGPASVTIPAGTTSTTFSVRAVSSGKANITAALPDNSARAFASVVVSRPAPVLSSVTPNTGPTSTIVTLNGTGFSLLPRQNVVIFEQNGQTIIAPPDLTKVINTTGPTMISAAVPPLANGMAMVSLIVIDNNGVPTAPSNKLTFTVIGAPTIANISPNPAVVGTIVTITGDGFSQNLAENAVLFAVPHLTIPGSPQPVFAQGKVLSATTTQLRVRVPGYAANGPVVVVRNPARPLGQDAGLARLDRMGGAASALYLDFMVLPADNFLASDPILTLGNAFPESSNLAIASGKLIALNSSRGEVLIYDISGANVANPLFRTKVQFQRPPVELVAGGSVAVVGLTSFLGGSQGPNDPVAQVIDLQSNAIAGSIMLTGTPPPDVKVALTGTTAIVTAGGTLYTFDVANAASPTQLGSLALGNFVNALAADGTLVLASLGDRLAVVDISDPRAPVLKSTLTSFSQIDSGSFPFDLQYYIEIEALTLKGTTGVAAVNGLLAILDLAMPSAPKVVGSAGLNFEASSLVINGTTLIASSEIAGVMLVDISTPNQPLTISFYDTPGGDPAVVGVASMGDFIYTNEAFSFFTSDFEVSNGLISTIKFSGALSTSVPRFAVLANGPISANDVITLRGFNLGSKPSDVSVTISGQSVPVLYANPTSFIPSTNITEVTVKAPSTLPTTGEVPINVQVGASVATTSQSVDAGGALKRFRSLSTGTPGTDAMVRIGATPFVVVANDFLGLTIINTDTGEIASRITVGQLRTTPVINQYGYARVGLIDYLVIFGFNPYTQVPGLTMVNVSNPAKPFVASETAVNSFASSQRSRSALSGRGSNRLQTSGNDGPYFDDISTLAVAGTLAFVHTDALHVFDISNPALPVLKGTYKPQNAAGGQEFTSGLAVMGSGTVALVTFQGSIHYLNAVDPANIQVLGKFVAPPPSPTMSPTSFQGAVAFVNATTVVAASEYNSTLFFVDFATPANPVVLSQLQARARGFVVDMANNLLLLVNEEGNPFASNFDSGDLIVVDIRNLTTPYLAGSINTPGAGRGAVMMGTNLYALADGADSVVGLHLISLDPAKLLGPPSAAAETKANDR